MVLHKVGKISNGSNLKKLIKANQVATSLDPTTAASNSASL